MYKLIVFTQMGPFETHGPEKDLRAVFNDWVQDSTPDSEEFIVIRGEGAYNNSRDPISHCIKRELIGAMTLVPWS